jgi:hypothetical protein
MPEAAPITTFVIQSSFPLIPDCGVGRSKMGRSTMGHSKGIAYAKYSNHYEPTVKPARGSALTGENL